MQFSYLTYQFLNCSLFQVCMEWKLTKHLQVSSFEFHIQLKVDSHNQG